MRLRACVTLQLIAAGPCSTAEPLSTPTPPGALTIATPCACAEGPVCKALHLQIVVLGDSNHPSTSTLNLYAACLPIPGFALEECYQTSIAAISNQ